jgi:outer membrane lipoprotein-sorting protein
MTSTRMARVPAACCVALAVAAAGAAEPPRPAATNAAAVPGDWQGGLQGIRTVQTGFREEKHLALLRTPLVLEGRIALDDAGRLAWHVLRPIRYSLVVTAQTVRQWDEDSNRVQTQSVDANPVLKAVVDQFRHWFSGRTSALSAYDVAAGGEADTLVFTPRAAAPEARLIREVAVAFRPDRRYLRQIRIRETSGDTVSLVFTNTVLNADVDPREWEIKPDGR